MAQLVQTPSRRWLVRIAWLVAFWIVGVASVTLVALFMRGLMRLAGMTT
jgi:Protein of unknown function (DUF2474)